MTPLKNRLQSAIVFYGAVCVAVANVAAAKVQNSSHTFMRTNSESLVEGLRSRIIDTSEFNEDMRNAEHLKSCEVFLYHTDDAQNKTSVSEIGRLALITKIYGAVYNDILMQRYDNFNELRESGGPHVDQELCLQQLRHIHQRAKIQDREKYASKDVNLAQLLDTFGRVPAGLYLGFGFWPGTYEECQRLSVETPNGNIPTRYCVASLRHKSWPDKNSPTGMLTALKSGVCLPKSCDSLDYKNKWDLVLKLIEFNARNIDRDQAHLSDLYCLPDPESPLRKWWLQPATNIVVVCLALWVSLLVYATWKYENKREGETDKSDKLLRSLSIVNNARLLFNTNKTSSLMETGNKLKGEEPEKLATTDKRPKSFVDLHVLEGIKVVAMSYVIMGHVLMCMPHIINNARDTGNTSSPFFFMANLAPAFAVNSFFTITGLLTSYLIFKQNQSFSFMTSPFKWLAFIVYRYARIMPMYVLVVIYTKYLAKYVGSGPFWDYGTSVLAHRRKCEQESWLYTILFSANLKSPLDHCIPSAWYLANDFQFFLITPIFLSLLHTRPKLGKILLLTCMAAGSIAGFMSIFNAELEDLRPIARFMPHGFKTYVTHLHFNYTRPQNRIPSYLLGLLFGYYLYVYERDRLKFAADKEEQKSKEPCKQSQEEVVKTEPDWSDALKRYGLPLSASIISVCTATPVIGHLIPFDKSSARVAVALVMPSYHLLFSLSVGIYILLATTGHGNRHLNALLSASFWKPLARLSLCVVLVNVEVIIYLTQIQTRVLFMNTMSHMSLNLISLLASYLVATAVCLFFEAPVRAALGHLLSFGLSKVATARTSKKEV